MNSQTGICYYFETLNFQIIVEILTTRSCQIMFDIKKNVYFYCFNVIKGKMSLVKYHGNFKCLCEGC